MRHNEYIPHLGSLVIVDILDFYDKPMLVSLKNLLDHYYLAIMIDDLDDVEEIWLFTEISARRLDQVKTGGFTLKEAFLNSESAKAFTVRIPYNPNELATIKLEFVANEIPIDYLPPENDRLSIEVKEQIDDIQLATEQINRVIVRLRLHFPNIISREAPVSQLGRFLVDIQDLLNSISQALKEKATEMGRIPINIVTENELNLRTVFNSSFGIELVSAKLPNLWGETAVDAVIDELVELIKIGNEADLLTEKMKVLKPRVAKNYYDFLGDIEKYLNSADIEWAAPIEGKYNKATISKVVAASARTIIELGEQEPTEIIEVRGELVGLNLRTRSFEIKTEMESISGQIPKDRIEAFRGTEIGLIYSAKLIQKNSLKLTIGKIEISYELANLSR